VTPPQHAIDASPILVLSTDPAWDDDRIQSELAGCEGEEKDAHPFVQYSNGHTRYDLTARSTWKGGTGSARDYLNEGAVMFHLRRHRPMHMAEVQDAFTREFGREGPTALLSVWLKSAGYGIKEITGAEDLAFDQKPGAVPESILLAIIDTYGLKAITKIGSAAFAISQPLRESEKKV